MNIKLVLKVLGRVLQIEACTLAVPAIVALCYRESLAPFLLSAIIIGAVGTLLTLLPSERRFYIREGFAAVGLIWLTMCLMGALPFWFSGEFPSYVDCFFECASGFTTTGSTILTDIESMSRGILFWRSFTHWLGGMGVLVLATAVLPSMGVRSQYLTQAESPGPVFSKLVPKQSQTSKILYGIYFFLTATETVLLKLAGMPLYDAFIHAFSSAGTGGFSNRNASVGAYGSPVIDVIITIFILMFSVNFAVYFLLLTKKFRDVLASDELRFFLVVVVVSTVVITFNILPIYGTIPQALRYAAFQVASIISTTGFGTADYALWPQVSQVILILIMFCGACAGSTGGGMKCSRVLVLLRTIRREIHRILHPRSVEVVTLDGKLVDPATVHSILTFVGCYLLLVLGGTLVVSLDGESFAVSFSAALTCMSNVGPGLEKIGPAGNFAAFSAFPKAVLSVLMITGRLEIFPVLILFSRSTWQKG